MLYTKVIVKGRVQGVAYRYYCGEVAMKLGISGLVKNLPTGDVEIIIDKSHPKTYRLIDWARYGSPSAKVRSLTIEDIELPTKLTTFDIVR